MSAMDDNDVSPLTEADWNFDDVPDDEVVACSIWEYARESETIHRAAGIYWCNTRHISHRDKYLRHPEIKAKDDDEAQRIEQRTKAAGFNYEEFTTKFWESDSCSVNFYHTIIELVDEGARAWRALPVEARKKWRRQVLESSIRHPVAQAFVGELEQLWKFNRTDLEEIRSRSRPPNDDSEKCALWAESKGLQLPAQTASQSNGRSTVALTMDFAHFTDREMLLEIEQWLKANRPAQWKRPLRLFPGSSQRGRKLIEYRVALERLGLMRLLHWYTPLELRRDLPNAWARYGAKQSGFRREIREACKSYIKLLPFVPSSERPISRDRKGIWFGEMMAICDEMEREVGKCAEGGKS